MRHISLLFTLFALLVQIGMAQDNRADKKFQQLIYQLSTPNTYRTASGFPGQEYWQQQADYKISVTLDDEKQRITGSEIITYKNNSPHTLPYLWVQLEQNSRLPDAIANTSRVEVLEEKMSFDRFLSANSNYDGGYKLVSVENTNGQKLNYAINSTMMRIDLTEPLAPGGTFSFQIKWWYNVNDRLKVGGGRSGMEFFPADGNYIYTIAQFFPRMAVYSDATGWQNKQFIGAGEFTLPFGNYEVEITVPADHIVGATGVLQNANEVMTETQLKRMAQAEKSDVPVIIVNQNEAVSAEKNKSKNTKTWKFKAENVRDFAFASSRKFIWDAQRVLINNKQVMAMSYYPKEGNPLWEQYSTRAVAHTLKVYSRFTFDYPYPVAISVHTDRIGMEYPMICFNGGRPEADGTYSERTKWSMIGVVIHEVGHNFFPMIINSDERQWTWMDEGMNSFLQGIAEREWDKDYKTWNGNPARIKDYMKSSVDVQNMIMTNSESVISLHANAYHKPAAALNVLRETVMGRELFDFAFRQYAKTWMFKHPTPDDFFRIMEDASAVDLDWFWNGWFYSNDHVNMAITGVRKAQIGVQSPADVKSKLKVEDELKMQYIYFLREKNNKSLVEKDAAYRDFYDSYNEFEVTPQENKAYQDFLNSLTADEMKVMKSGKWFTEVTVENKGGLVMPLIFEITYTDKTTEIVRIPAEIWRRNAQKITKVFTTEKEIESLVLDPFQEMVDVDMSDNYFPPRIVNTRIEMFKQNRQIQSNPMQRK